MSFTPHTKPLRMAALVAGAALGAGTIIVPSFAFGATVTVPTTTVSRISVAKGPQAGSTQLLLISGKALATWTDADTDGVVDAGELAAKAVKFGDVTVPGSDVTPLSADVLKIAKVPAAAAADKLAVLVTVGDAVKGPKYQYAATTSTATVKENFAAISESGATGLVLTGTNFDAKLTKISVGGKAVAKPVITATTITFAAPAGLTGIQDVVVTDARSGSYYAGYVTYSAKAIAITATGSAKALVEAPVVVKLTGTDLDLVTGATFGTEKATLKKVDATHVDVTVPKGVAKTAKITLTTKYGATAQSADVVRAASVSPTVSAVATVVAAGGEVTLTGTNFTGLKTATLAATVGTKVYAGAKITVVSDTSAKVTFPAVPGAGAVYKLKVTNWNATASGTLDVTVGTAPATTTTTTTTP